ncbi:MAG: sugar kinase [Pseudomonadota bacterium]|nr:sugar kinase [Pseudomonadota bacterium]
MDAADRTVDIVALGEAMIELNAARSATGDTYLRGYGGDTSNMAIAAARLGRSLPKPLRVAYATRVGDDTFGRLLLDLWRREHVDTAQVAMDPSAPTGMYFVTHGAQGHEFSYMRAGSAASRMTPASVSREQIEGARLLHVSGISAAISPSACDAVLGAIAIARDARTLVSFDPNLRLKLWPLARARAVTREAMRSCNVFLPSLDEARTLSGRENPDEILDWAHDHGPSIVALKCGTDGVWISDARERVQVPAHKVAAIDATGAGDCFDGAFCVRILAHDDAFSAGRYANAAAALATLGFGAVAPLPDDAAVRALLERA